MPGMARNVDIFICQLFITDVQNLMLIMSLISVGFPDSVLVDMCISLSVFFSLFWFLVCQFCLLDIYSLLAFVTYLNNDLKSYFYIFMNRHLLIILCWFYYLSRLTSYLTRSQVLSYFLEPLLMDIIPECCIIYWTW